MRQPPPGRSWRTATSWAVATSRALRASHVATCISARSALPASRTETSVSRWASIALNVPMPRSSKRSAAVAFCGRSSARSAYAKSMRASSGYDVAAVIVAIEAYADSVRRWKTRYCAPIAPDNEAAA